MCGIVGMGGRLSYEHEKAFKDMLVIDAIRGFDGVGSIVIGNTTNDIKTYKNGCDVSTFIQTTTFKDLFTGVNKCAIGHNRWATKGACSSLNAHPFHHSNIIGVHNGTLKNQKLLPDHELFEVDSDNVFYSIAEKGIEWTWAHLHGAAALVWWDSDDKTLNVIRNSERPLYYCFTKDRTQVLFASEYHMIFLVASRHNIKMETHAHPFEVNDHYVFDMSSAFDTKAEVTYTVESLEEYTPPFSSYSYGSSRFSGSIYGVKNKDSSFDDKEEERVTFTFDKEMSNANAKYGTNCVTGATVKIFEHQTSKIPLELVEDDMYTGVVKHVYQDGVDTIQILAAPSIKAFEQRVVVDHKGEELTKEAFDSRYFICEDCNQTVFYEDDNVYTGEYTVRCPQCTEFYKNMEF